ncbi:hypothetical protein GCM10023223_33050 [Stackebrandtia albiflava]
MGESVAAATTAVAEALGDRAHFDELATLTCGGLLIVFSMWWLYFALPAHELLTSVNRAFVWGYGHYVIFASVAAAGAGLAAHIDVVTGDSALTGWWRGGVVAVPVALYLWVLWALQMKPRAMPGRFQPVLPVAGVVVLASAGTPEPVLATGVVTAVVTGGAIVVSSRSAAASGRAGTGEAT